MTTNQTIDGVPRDLLQKIADGGYCHQGLMDRLRALLDADKVNNRQMGLMQYVEAHPIKPAAQPQGEPVAWIDWSGGDCPVDADAMVEYAMAGNPQQGCRPEVACRLDWRHDHRPTKRKSNIVKYRAFAEQPAPVAVVMPERMTLEKPEHHTAPVEIHNGVVTGWNACLDELKILNPTRPAHANPPPGTEPSGAHHDNDGLDDYRNTK